MAGKTLNINTGASTAVNTVTAPQNQYTQDYFLAHVQQDISKVETKQSDTKTMQFPSDIGRYYMTLAVSKYSRNDLFSVALSPENFIRLPVPKQMVDSHGVTYEQKELGTGMGAITSEALNAVGGTDKATSLLNSFASVAGAASLSIASALGNKVGIPVQDIFRAATGIAPNQFLTVLLKGPQYKKHQFSWTLSPRNAAESETLRLIIANLNEYMAPGFSAAGSGFFSFPRVFELSFSPSPKMLYRFLPAVIENMSVNYAPSGPAFYAGTDAPSSIELTINFLELEFWLSGRGQYQV